MQCEEMYEANPQLRFRLTEILWGFVVSMGITKSSGSLWDQILLAFKTQTQLL